MLGVMNVLWFSHLVPYPETGMGVLQRSYNLLRELARAHRVYLLAFVQRKIVQELLGDVESGLEQARRHLEQYCARVQFLPIPSESQPWGRRVLAARSLVVTHPYTIGWLQSKEAVRLATEWNTEIDFDLVHFDTLSLAPYKKLFARSAMTLDHHNIESHMMLRRAHVETQPFKRFYFWQEGLRLRRYERRTCPTFDLNITCSTLDTDRLAAVAPGVKVTEIPNGVDTEYFRPDEAAEQPLSVVFAGNMSWYPNSAAMLFFTQKVWPPLKCKIPGVRMNVVGGNPPPALLALADRDINFRVHGLVPDVRPYLGQSAVYVCPITDGGGTKLKILDALAMGKAIVAHPIACEGISVRDGYDVMFAREPDEFVNGIVTLLEKTERRRALSHNARALAESTYSYKKIGRKLIDQLAVCAEQRADACRSHH